MVRRCHQTSTAGAPLCLRTRESGELGQPAQSGPRPPTGDSQSCLVVAMLGFRLDAVKSNAAACLQHLCYRSDKVNPRLTQGASSAGGTAGATPKGSAPRSLWRSQNISFGRDQDNKIAARNCGPGIPALVRLLRKARDMDLTGK